MALGKRVEERLEELGISQEQLAEKTGVTQSAISALIKRDSKSSRSLFKLASALRCDPAWLETGKGKKELTTVGASLKVLSNIKELSLEDKAIRLAQSLPPNDVLQAIQPLFEKMTLRQRAELARLALEPQPQDD
ncbi:MAG: helix-turn-helix transcriptional regulator [Pseudomonadota bacterium]